MSFDRQRIANYINKTRFIVLATVRDGRPALRTIAGFAVDGLNIYFSTHHATDKVRQLEENPAASVLFEHENQSLRTFYNVTIAGTAERVTDQAEIDRIISLIGARSPRYQERAARGDLVEQAFFRIRAEEVTVLDFGISPGHDGMQRFRIDNHTGRASALAA